MSILNPIGSFPQPKKIFRFGAYKPNHTRPLKIVYESGEEAKSVLRSNKSNTNKLLLFRSDLTILQRNSNTAVLKKFKDRKSRGESDIFLSYKNNLAQITHKFNVKSQRSENV